MAAAQSLVSEATGAPSPLSVAAFVQTEALAYGVDPVDALGSFPPNPRTAGTCAADDGQSRGYWMISDVWHPEVSTACADDLQCSMDWSLRHIEAGFINEWATWRFRFKWYADQNPPVS